MVIGMFFLLGIFKMRKMSWWLCLKSQHGTTQPVEISPMSSMNLASHVWMEGIRIDIPILVYPHLSIESSYQLAISISIGMWILDNFESSYGWFDRCQLSTIPPIGNWWLHHYDIQHYPIIPRISPTKSHKIPMVLGKTSILLIVIPLLQEGIRTFISSQ